MTPIARLLVGTAALLLLLAPSASAADDPLVRAAAASDMTAVRALLRQGHDVDSRAADGSTALHWAVRAEDLDTINALLRAGAHATVANALGVTPIYVAAEQGHAAILRRLLDAGADVKTTDASGDTLLMAAVRAGNADAVDVLLERGAPVNAGEHTALMWAARRNDTAIMKRLLAHGAEVDTRTGAGEKPAARPPGAGGGSHGVGIVRSGVPQQGEQQPIPGGMTPLLFAARDGQVDAAALLAEAGADVNGADPNGITPLVMALTNGQFAVAKLLLDRHADVRRADWWGRAPLWAAVDARNLPVRSGAPADENGVDRAGRPRCHRDAPRPRRRRQRAREGVSAGAAISAAARVARVGGLHRPDAIHPRRAGWRCAGDAAAALEGRGPEDRDVQRDDRADGGRRRELGHRRDVLRIAERGGCEAVQLCLDQSGSTSTPSTRWDCRRCTAPPIAGPTTSSSCSRSHGAELDRPDKEGRTPYVWAQGVFLATNSPVAKPSTLALLDRLTNGAASRKKP